MKYLVIPSLGLALASGAALAQDAQQLLKEKNCLTCHALDNKVVGPAYKDVANKYRGDKTAQAKLEEKVKKGGVGTWGQVPMPPNSQVSDADVKTLVTWILGLK